ncbi:MAG: DUF3047 domain-containing protein [Spirochaetia bacterium]|jgi:hypothetical protein|nr:DUF3047 domain-containing protein [Spirochaetia bacterium]
MKNRLFILLLLFSTAFFELAAQQYIVNEDFASLDKWEPLIFPKIERHTKYSTEISRDESVLKITSSASASGIIYSDFFNVSDWPVIEWRWKASNIFKKGNAKKKSGDDYPVRLYIIFEYSPEEAAPLVKLKYNIAKLLYGKYPPDSALNYVYASSKWDSDFIPNAFTSSAIMFASDSGEEHLGQWRTHRVNILEDYRRAFGKEPPVKASLAIMGDSDNTEEESQAFIDYIRVTR